MTEDQPLLDVEALLNPEEQARYRRLCLATSTEDLVELRDDITVHLDQVRAQAGPDTDVETAVRIADSLSRLLEDGAVLDAGARALVRGAVEYFILADDAVGDLDDVLGFDDDARIVNAMLDRVGRPELRVLLD